MNEDPFAKNAQRIIKIYHKVLLLMEFLQTKQQVRTININYYDLCYTVIKNRVEKEIINIKNENYENDFIKFNDIIPIHIISIKHRDTILKYRNLRSVLKDYE